MFAPRIVALLTLGLLADACRDAAGPGPPVATLRFEQDTPRVEAGKTLQLTLAALDRSGRPVRGTLVDGFRSEDPAIATAGATGLVTGVAQGSTRIHAFAGNAEAAVTVVVDPRGGLYPDVLTLLVPGGGRRLYVDSWPLLPQLLPFSLRNEAGGSLCGRVPLRIEVRDTALLTASHQPSRDGCSIRLAVPPGTADGGTTMLRVRAGLAADSVEVDVHRTFYRVLFDRPPSLAGPQPSATAGSRVRYQLTAVPNEGMPAAGIPVTFRIDTARRWYTMVTAGTLEVQTDSAGIAFVDAQVSTSTLLRRSGYIEPDRGLWVSAWSTPLRFQAQDAHSPPLRIVAGEPHHIAVYVDRSGWRFQEWLQVSGDSVAVGPVTEICSSLWPRRSGSVGAAVVDRYGNAIAAPPVVASASTGYTRTAGGFILRTSWSSGPTERLEYPDGALLQVNREHPWESATFTFSYPGLPSRTVRVIPNARCGE